MATKYQRCPFQPRSSLSVIGNVDPSDACTVDCKLATLVTGPNGGIIGHDCKIGVGMIALFNLAQIMIAAAKAHGGQVEEIPPHGPSNAS